MKLILVRHGETDENAQKIIQGWMNTQLNEKGVLQAKKIAERLKEEKIDLAYSSDLDRCTNTCQEILKFHPGTKIFKDKRLREQNKGVFQGTSNEERNAMNKKLRISFHKWDPEGGESLEDVFVKMVSFYRDILKKHPQETVLAVSSGGPMACLLAYLHEKTAADFLEFLPKGNTMISEIMVGDKVEFLTKNCADHLNH